MPMARVKVKTSGGKTKGMDARQAAQLGLDSVPEGVPQETGSMTAPVNSAAPTFGPIPGAASPTVPTTQALAALDKVDLSRLSPEDRTVYEGVIRNAKAPKGTPVNPAKQKSMFGAVQTQTRQNPQTDIMNIDANRWKAIQRKAGLTEV